MYSGSHTSWPSLRLRTQLPSSAPFESAGVDLHRGAWLRGAVGARLGRDVPAHDDRAGQAASLVVAGRGAVPVVARPVELESGRALRVVHQPEEPGVAIARHDRAVGVLVVVDERDLDRAA